jgi:hypothetical protein
MSQEPGTRTTADELENPRRGTFASGPRDVVV